MTSLKQLLGDNVINFDKRQDLSDVKDWRGLDFDYFIANHVLYELDESELHQLCRELKKYLYKKKLVLIIGIAKQGILSRLGKFFLNRQDAHKDTKISPSEQIKIINTYFKIKKRFNFWFLTEIILISELN